VNRIDKSIEEAMKAVDKVMKMTPAADATEQRTIPRRRRVSVRVRAGNGGAANCR